jgi:hypothetical protein
MPVYTFTADFLSWSRGHILVHALTSEHIQCATAFSLPAPGRPACTLLARLHPVVWATNLHLNVVARGRAPEIDCLYPPSWGCLDRQVQRLFCYGLECAVMMLKSQHNLKQLYFSQSAFKRSTIIEEHRNWSVAGQKLIFQECSWIFPSVTSPCVPSIGCFDSIVFEPTNSDTHVYWEPSFSKTMLNENS